MKHKHDGMPKLIAEVKASQRNTAWFDVLRNGRSVDSLLWKASPTAKPVRRIGVLIPGLAFFLVGAAFYAISLDQHSFTPLGTLLTFAAGTRLTINAARGLAAQYPSGKR